jgi:hypothetical protein
MIKTLVSWIGQQVDELNLYESDDDNLDTIHRERLFTRGYLSLMGTFILGLIFYTGFTVRTNTITVIWPTQTQFEDLFEHHGTSLQCLCTEISIPYGSFVEVDVTFHHVCSTKFIKHQWIQSIYAHNVTYIGTMHVRTILSAFWQLVAAFCKNSDMVIANVLSEYNTSTIFSWQVMSTVEVETRAQASFNFALTMLICKCSRPKMNLNH